MQLPLEDRINFLVGIHVDYGQNLSGGIVAMHRLAYKLAERGHNVYIFAKPQYPHENLHTIKGEKLIQDGFIETFTWEHFTYPVDRTVSIYPQITRNNPFNTQHVVRWILYHTEKPIEDGYGENDVYFNYNNFKTYEDREEGKLTVFDYNLDRLYDKGRKRNGFCHIIHKHTPPGGEEIFKKFNSTDLTDWKSKGNYDYLNEKMNEFEYFLTYDQNSFYTVAATLCGCKAIILKDGNSYEFAPNAYSDSNEYQNELTPTEFRLNNPIQMFGIAYGIDDISWANKTIDLQREHIENLEKIDDKTVDQFVKYWENKIFGR